jgi:ABC-type amino acid transport system permease subunit
MTGLSALWLPILLSAVFALVASFALHMLPWHRSDYRTLPNEDKARDVLRALAIPPGDYMVPKPSSGESMGSPAFDEKLKKGPVMVLTVMPNGEMSMGRMLGLWFLYCLAMSVLAAYVTGRALPPGTPYLRVFRFAGATAFIGYSGALWQMAIWYRRSLTTTVKSTIDGLIYGLLTAGAFGWLWPR